MSHRRRPFLKAWMALITVLGLLAAPSTSARADCDPTACGKLAIEVAEGAASLAWDLINNPQCSADLDGELAVAALLLAATELPNAPFDADNCSMSKLESLVTQGLLPQSLLDQITQIIPDAQLVADEVNCGCMMLKAGVDTVKNVIQEANACASFNPGSCLAKFTNGQCTFGCPTATQTTENTVVEPTCPAGKWIAGQQYQDGKSYAPCACPGGMLMIDYTGTVIPKWYDAVPSGSFICSYCPLNEARQNGTCAACPAAKAMCQVNPDGNGYTSGTDNYSAATDGSRCIANGTGNMSVCPSNQTASQNGNSCSCSVPACLDGTIENGTCTCGENAHPVLTANLAGNPNYGFKNVCTCNSGFTPFQNSCVPAIACSNSWQQGDPATGKCVDICPAGWIPDPSTSSSGSPPKTAPGQISGPNGTQGNVSPYPGCMPCGGDLTSRNGQCVACAAGTSPDGNGGCTNSCGPHARFVSLTDLGPETVIESKKRKASSAADVSPGKMNLGRCVPCSRDQRADPSDPTKCLPAKFREPKPERVRLPPGSSALERPSSSKGSGGEIAKPKQISCPPRMHANAAGTGCVPNLDLGDDFGPGSALHGVVPRTGGPRPR